MPYTGPPGAGGGGGEGGSDPVAMARANAAFSKATSVEQGLGTHKASDTPHPIYDNMLDLRVLFENGLI